MLKKFTIIFLATAAMATAQVSLDVSAPRLEGVDHRGVNGLYALTVDLDSFALEFGLARFDDGRIQKTSFANPKISFRTRQRNYLLTYFVYAPVTAYNQAGAYGMFATPEAVGMYVPDALSGGGMINRKFMKSGLDFSVTAGSLVMIALKRTALVNNLEIFIPYNFSLSDRRGNLTLGGELAGNYLLTQTEASFNDNILSQFKIFSGWHFGKFFVSTYVKFPVDKNTDMSLRNTLGVSLQYK
jgi:hypothetical protein